MSTVVATVDRAVFAGTVRYGPGSRIVSVTPMLTVADEMALEADTLTTYDAFRELPAMVRFDDDSVAFEYGLLEM